MVCHNLIGNILKKSFSGYITVHPTIHAILDKKKCGVTMPILQIRQLRLRAGKETHSGRDTAWVGGRGLRRIPSRRGPCPPSHRPVSRGLRQVRSSCPQDILQQPRGKGDLFLLFTGTVHLSRHGALGSLSQKQAPLSKYQKLPHNSSIYVKCPEEVKL